MAATGPADPFGQIDQLAAAVVEQYQALVKASVPPTAVAVMLGQMMAAIVIANASKETTGS